MPAETTALTTVPTEPDVPDDGVLKILAIGNGFSKDSMHLLYEIAQREGTEKIVLGNLVIGGCSLATHAYNIMAKEPAYSFLRNDNGEWKQ